MPVPVPRHARQWQRLTRAPPHGSVCCCVQAAFVGNVLITVMKFSMWMKTGSSAMFSEAMHTLVDVGNQAFLLLGLRQASMAADTTFQYGYGRAAFFWSLVSALGMFWMGACVSTFHGA